MDKGFTATAGAIIILVAGIIAAPLQAQIQQVPIPITPWQLLDEMTVFEGDLYIREFPERLWRYDGADMHLVADRGEGRTGHVAGFLEVVGDHLYFAYVDGGSSIWRTDGESVELVIQFPGERAHLEDGDAGINMRTHRIGDALYFSTLGAGTPESGIYKISSEGIEQIPSPEFQSAFGPIGYQLGDAVIFAEQERAPGQEGDVYYLLRDDTVSTLTSDDLGLSDRPFHVVGVSEDWLFVWADNEAGQPTIFRSDLASSEELFQPDPVWLNDFEVYDQGTTIYMRTNGFLRRLDETSGISEVKDPHTGTFEQWYYNGRDVRSLWGQTDGVMSRRVDGSGGKLRHAQLGASGLEKLPDADLLYDSEMDAFRTIAGWCVVYSSPSHSTECVTDGEKKTYPYRVPQRGTELDGRIYYTTAGIRSVSPDDLDAGYQQDIDVVSNDVRFLGNLHGEALIRAGHPDGRAVWTTDGEVATAERAGQGWPDAEFIAAGTAILSFDGLEPHIWTFDGENAGSAADYFGGDFDFKYFRDGQSYGDDVLFQVVNPVGSRGLWRRGNDGTVKVASYEPIADLVVIESLAYIQTSINGSGKMFAYDGQDIKLVSDIPNDKPGHRDERKRVIGDALLVEIGSESWLFRNGEGVKLDETYSFRGSTVHDDGWLYFSQQGHLWRTNTEEFEELFGIGGWADLRSSEGSLYYIDNAGLDQTIYLVVEGQPTVIAGPETEFVSWAPESTNGAFATIGGIPHRVSADGIEALASEPFTPLGWSGTYMIGTKPHIPGVFAINVEPSSVAIEGIQPGDISFEVVSYPNPAGAVATVQIMADRDDVYGVEVRDVLGRLVANLHRGPLTTGTHEFRLESGEMAPGMYFVRATGTDRTVAAPIIVRGR